MVAVEGERLILLDGPRRFIGPGESVNIVDPSLQIEGSLTATDRCLPSRPCASLGQQNVMLSFVEQHSDLTRSASFCQAPAWCRRSSRSGSRLGARWLSDAAGQCQRRQPTSADGGARRPLCRGLPPTPILGRCAGSSPLTARPSPPVEFFRRWLAGRTPCPTAPTSRMRRS